MKVSAGSRVVVAMNAFKGSLDAASACRSVCRGIALSRPDLRLCGVPLADGGDGTLDVLAATWGGVRVTTDVTGPRPGRSVEAEWLWRGPTGPNHSASAVIEMASTSGLRLLRPGERDPLRTTSRGTGELLLTASRRGVADVVLALGGSGTVDGGVGAARALGWRFLSDRGAPIPEGGAGLLRLAAIAPPDTDPLADISVLALLDVDHPLCGPSGAARVFGPQKGASADDVLILEEGLERLADRIEEDLGLDLRHRPGGGAAGGLGAGAVAFFGASTEAGTDFVMGSVGLEGELARAGHVVTGEGRLDATSLRGKVVDGVITRADATGVSVSVLTGSTEAGIDTALPPTVAEVVVVTPPGVSLDDAMRRAEGLLETAAARMAEGWMR